MTVETTVEMHIEGLPVLSAGYMNDVACELRLVNENGTVSTEIAGLVELDGPSSLPRLLSSSTPNLARPDEPSAVGCPGWTRPALPPPAVACPPPPLLDLFSRSRTPRARVVRASRVRGARRATYFVVTTAAR